MDTHNMLPTQAEMWQAVTSNDTTYDDRFVYAVKSTGIYCRPSCKSRDPKPENIAYYATPSDAREAGFRACKRCQPDNATTDQQARVQGMCEYIAANLDGDLSLDALAAVFSLSPYHLQRTFKAAVGLSPKQYADTLRMERFKDHLREGDSVTNAIYQAGYGSSSRLYERVSEELGMTPTDYQRGGDQQTLFYTTALCALGVLMVAATERGLCAVRLGHSANALVVELADEFDGATCLPDETRLKTAVSAILSYIDGETSDIDLPLDIKATAFQRRVWDALRQIPCGETRSYGEVAEAIGQPTASRAVGNACANNPVALVVPCHRVVKSGGAMGNYRWGIERKERLLEAEREHSG